MPERIDPGRVDLAHCMGLPPEQAIAYLRSKGYALSWRWEEVWQDAQAKAFTVAKVARLDLLEDIRRAVDTALAEGRTLRWFQQTLTPVLQAKGWWGKRESVDTETGEIRGVQLGSPWRLQTIYRTNLQTAYMAGRYAAQIENAEQRPYWQYVAVLDGRTRPSHRAMNGRVFRYDDPIWREFYPPNGWSCRCRVTTLSESALQRAGLRVESSAGRLGSTQKLVSKQTGELQPVATFETRDPFTGKTLTVSPDVGWSYNPGRAATTPNLNRYGGALAAIARYELS